jgi:hypothetical protein
MLVLAYTRLFLLPEREDGSKLVTVASFGLHTIRLIEMQASGALPQLWVELYDCRDRKVLDSIGCRDMRAAGHATEQFVARAKRLNGIEPDELPTLA